MYPKGRRKKRTESLEATAGEIPTDNEDVSYENLPEENRSGKIFFRLNKKMNFS